MASPPSVAAEADAVTDYRNSLVEELTFNSKPVINMLTMVAEENLEHAQQIGKVIEERIHKVPKVTPSQA